MDTNLLLLILNIAFFVIIGLGFLIGLKGLKKSGIGLAFFVGSVILTFIFTPVITRALLNIQITVDGTSQTISQYIVSLIQQSGIVSDAVTAGSNMEALINNIPVMVGNIVSFMILLIVFDIIMQIICAIVCAIIFKKKKNINPISKNTPSNVSATGNVTYVREEPKPKKRRLLGGLVGAVHSLLFIVLLLIPVCSLCNLVTTLAFEQEPTASTATMALEDDPAQDKPKYTAFALQLQSTLPQELLSTMQTLNQSALFKVVDAVDINNNIFNGIACCKVNGQKVVLSTEVTSVATIYNNVEYISKLDLTTSAGIREIDFGKLRLAVDSAFNSGIIKSVVPETLDLVIEWTTADDISNLSEETQNIIKPLRDKVLEDNDLKATLFRLKTVLGDKNNTIEFLKKELNIVIDVCDMIVPTEILDSVMGETQNQEMSGIVFTELSKDNYKLFNNLVDKVFESDIVNVATLYGTNKIIDTLQQYFENNIPDASQVIEIRKLDIENAVNFYNKQAVKTAFTGLLKIFHEYDTIGFDEIAKDYTIMATDSLEDHVKALGTAIDCFKNLDILREFGTLDDILDNAMQVEIKINSENGEEKYTVLDFADLRLLKDKTFSAEQDFEILAPAVRQILTVKFEQDGKEIDFFKEMRTIGLKETILKLNKEQTSNILTPLGNSKLFKPMNVMLINFINASVKDTIGGDIKDLVADDVDLSSQVDDIVQVVEDVKKLLPSLEQISSGEKTLDDIVNNTEEVDAITSLLETLQDNANTNGENGAFTGVYNAMLGYVKDEANGLSGINEIIENNTQLVDDKSVIDWAQVIQDYLAK